MKNKEVFFHTPCGRVFRGVIRNHHVALQDGACNNELFDCVGVSDRHTFASTAYGYSACTGNWPHFREGDYPALERLFTALKENGVRIVYSGAVQKKHVTKNPATYDCNKPAGRSCRSKPAAIPCSKPAPAATPQCPAGGDVFVPTFRSPLENMTGHKW